MPSAYAHLRFGNQSLPRLPGEANILIRHFNRLYDVGLQGPDLFFYYNPLLRTEIGALGYHFHMQSGKEFFGHAIRAFRAAPSDGARAYLYGVLGHYCLDSVCHPYVREVAAEGKIGHTEMETEFDRLLMARDGIALPHRHSLRQHFRLTRGECATAAAFYNPVGTAAIRRCVRNMQMVSRLTTTKHRRMVRKIMGIGGKVGLEMVMTESPNENCDETDRVLLGLYGDALERYPILTEQLNIAMKNGTPLGSDFEPVFG